ncbi:testis specific protein Y-linked isoform X2 [Poecilia reticulata]|uniref:testis specific protein Y-linked isoform X2 n=1 Tax=Poecilia reticulata TaxID=8081 RepID=UPI0004A23B7C|nr:PREDICTED: testis-specific Y-encoded-like protein 1 isoform X2 [Poecilia reticulata]
MSEVTDYKQSGDPASRKRSASLDLDEDNAFPHKFAKVSDDANGTGQTSKSCENSEVESKEETQRKPKDTVAEGTAVPTDKATDLTDGTSEQPVNSSSPDGDHADITEKPQSSEASAPTDSKEETQKIAESVQHPSTPVDQSDSAAIAAAEALASLTGGDGEESQETPCSSAKVRPVKHGSKNKQRPGQQPSKVGSKTQAAADSSTSARSTDREDKDDAAEADEGDESVSGSSSTPSSSFPSDNEDNDDGECAIVSVKMAPEMRQSVALLAQVQMRLEALEKKSVRLHQRLELKINRQRRPHLDQRSSITKTIPGFWVTALLNHPHLSAHIDETDEDALSYMTDLEVESFKNTKLGYRIRFHFRRNPYFQNNIIMKELHLGMGGSPMSFSNPILWHRGHNLTANSEPRKSCRGVYETFFSWFSDHSNPVQDDVAQILKDDLYRDPLRYYLTPLWEPRENGSTTEARAAGNGNGDDCVVISDSDDEPGEDTGDADPGRSREDEEEEEDDDDEEEEGAEDEEEEEEEGRRASPDESQEEEEEEGSGEIVIDGSDDSDQEEEEEA